MTFCFAIGKLKKTRLKHAYFAVASLAALMGAGDQVSARSNGGERSVETNRSRTPGEPIMAIVSLHSQRITIYDANGWILRAPVSSGQRGRETPSGVFSIIQKEADHYSNLYDDAYMPHMQRITWSGIALHGGSLPGYPASHGCVRLPFDFAADLFDATRLGLRVIVAPTDLAPIEIAHPALFQSKPGAAALALVAARNAEADEAARKADQARLAAATAFREATQAMVPVRAAESMKLRARAHLAAAETMLGSAISAEAKEQSEDAKAKAVARLAEMELQVDAAKAERQVKLDSVRAAREVAAVAETARVAAAEAARLSARELEPVSVLVSRKTQRLYVRQSFEPLFEGPVTILDPDRPIGTHVFTAMERTGNDANIRWSVVSLEGERLQGGTVEPHARAHGTGRNVEPILKEPVSAKAALDRIVIPHDALDRIPGMTPLSSLIVTDEALSSETGKGTDFVVVLSDEPQGGIKFRRRNPATEFGYARARDRMPYWSPPSTGQFSTW
jgi:L,D-transpeptidase catalytic domain